MRNPHRKYDAFMDGLKTHALGLLVLLFYAALLALLVHVSETRIMEVVNMVRAEQPPEDFWSWLVAFRWPEERGALASELGRLLVMGFLLYVGVKLGVRWAPRLLHVSVRSKTYRPHAGDRLEDARGLVVFLSNARDREKHDKAIAAIDAGTTLEDVAAGRGIPETWNWQPLLAAILLCHDDRKGLNVVVITSTGTPGSDELFPQLKSTVEKLAPGVKLHQIAGVDFFNPHDIRDALEEAMRKLADMRIRDRQVLIDITSGTAQVSAMGSVFALQEGRRIIYSGNHADNVLLPTVYHPRVSFAGDLRI